MNNIEVYNFLDGKNFSNIFANLIVNKIEETSPNSKTKIKVINVRNFFVVKGYTSSNIVIILSELLQSFLNNYDKDKSEKVRVIDLITYSCAVDLSHINIKLNNQKLLNIEKNKIQNIIDSYAKDKIYINIKIENLTKYLYYDCDLLQMATVIKILKKHFSGYKLIKSDFINEIYVSDDFYGLSNNGEKLYYFLLKYITNHIFELGISKELNLSLHTEVNINKINNNNCKFEILNNNHIVKTDWLRSIILDVFPFKYNQLLNKFKNIDYFNLDLCDKKSQDLIWGKLDLISEIVLI